MRGSLFELFWFESYIRLPQATARGSWRRARMQLSWGRRTRIGLPGGGAVSAHISGVMPGPDPLERVWCALLTLRLSTRHRIDVVGWEFELAECLLEPSSVIEVSLISSTSRL